MTSSTGSEKGPYWDFFSKLPKDGFEFMFGGMDMYNKMTKAWMDYAQSAAKGKPEDLFKAWSDAMTGVYKDMSEMLAKSFKMPGLPPIMGKLPWGDPFEAWQQLLKEAPVGFMPPQEGIEEFIKFSRGWQKGYMKLLDAWLGCLEKTSEAYKSFEEKGIEPEKIWKSCLESSQGLLEAWVSFATEQTKAYYAFWESLMPKAKGTAKKGGAKTK
ncbi:MAG TPA: hypothetical protein VMT12_15880 [Syntrophales bacterium]|nr:hypothetical protein [Syntrophales bacterium]